MERAFLVGIKPKDKPSLKSRAFSGSSLEELARLVETAGGEVAGQTVQAIQSPNPATFVGKGKIEELRAKAIKKEFTTLVFDDELKPAQQKNISELVPAKILDRTRLILDIFAKRARTKEGILQVELAQLSYLLPRMTERYGRFEQQVGGIGTRGPGERKLEVEARHIRDRMTLLRRQVESIKMHRQIARERRQNVPLPTIAIVGYTNAGKSTLLNHLVRLYGQSTEAVYADDKLFATLDPTTRRIRLPSGRLALFTDTVGFINKLPHHLVAAFRATLEETLAADLIVHLMDASDPEKVQHSKIVLEILDSLETGKDQHLNKMIAVYNKADIASEPERLKIGQNKKLLKKADSARYDELDPIYISAIDGTGLNALLNRIENKLSEKMIETTLYVPFKNSAVLDSLYRLGEVKTVDHQNQGTHLRLKLEKSHWNKVQKLLESGAIQSSVNRL